MTVFYVHTTLGSVTDARAVAGDLTVTGVRRNAHGIMLTVQADEEDGWALLDTDGVTAVEMQQTG